MRAKVDPLREVYNMKLGVLEIWKLKKLMETVPQTIVKDYSASEVEALKKKFEQAGAVVSVVPSDPC